MHKGFEQVFLQRRDTNGYIAHEKQYSTSLVTEET